MARLSQNELKELIEKAKREVSVGTRYAHYKDPSKTYLVKDLVIDEATNEPGVIYQAEYGEKITFSRRLSIWLEQVKWQGQSVARFKRLS